jgi:hypothetical protein
MRKDMIYNLRILILETYVRMTMIGYESKQKRFAERFGHMEPEVDQAGIDAMSALKAGLPSMQFFQGRS